MNQQQLLRVLAHQGSSSNAIHRPFKVPEEYYCDRKCVCSAAGAILARRQPIIFIILLLFSPWYFADLAGGMKNDPLLSVNETNIICVRIYIYIVYQTGSSIYMPLTDDLFIFFSRDAGTLDSADMRRAK